MIFWETKKHVEQEAIIVPTMGCVLLFRPLKMGGTLDSGFFHAKSATKKTHRAGLIDISY